VTDLYPSLVAVITTGDTMTVRLLTTEEVAHAGRTSWLCHSARGADCQQAMKLPPSMIARRLPRCVKLGPLALLFVSLSLA